uniref:Pentatricopeptide repeat-containing protein n=1 Tax=Triticum urartu TaxID=4572 RepID=A0A8R7P1I8_TRIUA
MWWHIAQSSAASLRRVKSGQWTRQSWSFSRWLIMVFDQICIHAWNSFMYSLCKNGGSKEAAEFFDSMTSKGLKPNIVVYSTLLHGCTLQNGQAV